MVYLSFLRQIKNVKEETLQNIALIFTHKVKKKKMARPLLN